jgi:thiamine-phosphate pyrophosphorylase
LKDINRAGVNRIIDANTNRAKEGLRVCEEITRFVLNNNSLTASFKRSRHSIDTLVRGLDKKSALLSQRDASRDTGKKILGKEMHRGSLLDVFFANIQRAKESIRVLEEFSKLKNKKSALKFKELRYRLYVLEKKTAALL